MHGKPNPAEWRHVAALADDAAVSLARAAGAATAVVNVDDEILQAVALVTSWSAWLGKRAAAEPTEQP
jgi:hypothetical protein